MEGQGEEEEETALWKSGLVLPSYNPYSEVGGEAKVTFILSNQGLPGLPKSLPSSPLPQMKEGKEN